MSIPVSTDEQAGSVSAGSPHPSRFRLVRRRLVLLLIFLGLAAGVGFWVRPHARAWYHRRAARLEVQRYHNRQAIDHLLVCREVWPRDPETLLLSARVARRARVYGDCERLLRIYREVRGRDEAYTFEQLLLNAESRVDEFAVPCWQCVEEGRYDGSLLMEALTRGYLRQYRLGQAKMCLDRWKQDQPDNPQVFFLDGLFRLDYVHASTAAVDCYRRAVDLDPHHEEARLGLAVALMHDKNHAEAAEHFRRLRQGQPDNLRVQMGLAECLEGMGQLDEAMRIVDEIIAKQPDCAPALSLRGQLSLNSGRLAEAEADLRQAYRLNPTDHRTIYSLAQCLGRTGKEEESRQKQQELQQLEKDLTRFDELVTKEIAEKPNDPAVYFSIGQYLLRAGKREDGVRWLQRSLQIDPNYAPARQLLAERASQANGKPQSDDGVQ